MIYIRHILLMVVLLMTPVVMADDGPKNQTSTTTRELLHAPLIGFHMQEGDTALWRDPAFDSRLWPMSQRAGGTEFNRIINPKTIAWLRSGVFPMPKSYFDPERNSVGPLALYVTTGASYQVYWNGTLIGSNGVPGVDNASEQPSSTDRRLYLPPHLLQSEGNVIAIRYSAHGYKKLHLPLAIAIAIGPYQDQMHHRLLGYIPALLLIGGVGAAALFFGAIYSRNRRDTGSLWLALMFLMVVLQSFSEISMALFTMGKWTYVLRIVATFMFAYGSGLFLLRFLIHYFSFSGIKRRILWVSHFLVILALANFYNHWDKLTYAVLAGFIFSALLLSLVAVRNKQPKAMVLACILGLFSISFFAGYTAFLDRYYYLSMAMLAGSLFMLQAAAMRETELLMQEAKGKATQLELMILKHQIQPHFILNTLTALSEWILTDPRSSVKMVNALANEFRLFNHFSGKRLVPLKDEIELCQVHLQVMSFRQGQTFDIQLNIEDERLFLPPAVLHTLIENALTHSRFKDGDAAFILRQYEDSDGKVIFEVQTPVPLDFRSKTIARDQSRAKAIRKNGGLGVGLSYVRAQLQEIWGQNFTLEDGLEVDGRWKTVIRLNQGAYNDTYSGS